MRLFQGLLPIKKAQIPSEIIAGISLAAIAIPQPMGFTTIAGTPIITGIYTLLLPLIIFTIFGSSRHMVVNATSSASALLATGLVGLAAVGSDEYVALAGVLTIMVGILFLITRMIGLGFLANFLSSTVLTGFLTGVGIQITLGQVSGMMGFKGGRHGTLQKIWTDIQQIEQVNYYALSTAICAIGVIFLMKKISKKIPGVFIAVVGAVVVSMVFSLEDYMHVIGTVPGGLPQLGLPNVDWSWGLINKLLPTALSLLLLILAQSIAVSGSYALRYNDSLNVNDDLVGIGLANFGAALSGSFVVNCSPLETSAVNDAGGRTQLAQLVTVVIVVLVLLFLTAPLASLPLAAMSAVVFYIGIKLIKILEMKRIYRIGRSEFWVALATACTVVVIGIEQGIFLAIILSLIDHIRHGYQPKNYLMLIGKSGELEAKPISTGLQILPGLMIYRFTHSMYYANSKQLSEEVIRLTQQADPVLRWFCMDFSSVDNVDYTSAQTLVTVFNHLKEKGVRLVVAQVLESTEQSGKYVFDNVIGADAFYNSLTDVIKDYKIKVKDSKPKAKGGNFSIPTI